MAALKRSTIRQRVASAVAALDDYTESVHDYDHIGEDPNSYRNKSFAVGCLSSAPSNSRQRLTEGALVHTLIGVRSTYKLRPKDRITSVDEALDGQGDIIKAVMGMSVADLNLEVAELRRPAGIGGEWFFVESIFRIQHFLALQ